MSLLTAVMALWAVLGAGAAPATSAEAPAQAELSPRYTDPVNGFSLQPPARADFRKEFSPKLLASWLGRDDPRGPIVWQLRVLRAREADQAVELDRQVQTLRQRLSGQPGLKLESIKLIDLPAGPAIDLRTVSPATYERQVWAQNAPGHFIVLAVSGPPDRREQLDATLDQVLPTVELLDPTAAQQRRQQRLDRGRALLEGLSDDQLQRVFAPAAQWLMIRQADQPIGFTRIKTSSLAGRRGSGYVVEVLTFLAPQGGPLETLAYRMFLSQDRQEESWVQTRVTGPSPGSQVLSETGTRKADMIQVHLTSGAASRQYSRALDAAVRPCYLPRAISMVLGSLVDLSKAGEYAFASYNSQTNQFDVRTLTIEGPETLTQEGQPTPAIRVRDQPAEDAPASMLWLDQQGHTLRASSEDGLLLEPTTEQAAMAAFPQASEAMRTQE